MLDFYKKNLGHYVKMAWYKYTVYLAILALFSPLYFLLVVVLFLVKHKIPSDLFKGLILAMGLSPIIVAVLVGLALGLKGLYITIYSLRVERKESFELGHIWYGIYKIVTSLKVLLILLLCPLLIIGIGYLIHTQILSKSPLDTLKVGVSLILYVLLILLFLNREFFVYPLQSLWNLFTGILWKIALIFIVILSQILLIIGIYSFVTLLINIL